MPKFVKVLALTVKAGLELVISRSSLVNSALISSSHVKSTKKELSLISSGKLVPIGNCALPIVTSGLDRKSKLNVRAVATEGGKIVVPGKAEGRTVTVIFV